MLGAEYATRKSLRIRRLAKRAISVSAPFKIHLIWLHIHFLRAVKPNFRLWQESGTAATAKESKHN